MQCSSYITTYYIIKVVAFMWYKLFSSWLSGSCDLGKGRSNEERGINGLKVMYQNVHYIHHTLSICSACGVCDEQHLECVAIRQHWQKAVTAAGDKQQRLTLTHFVFAVADLISLREVTIFNSCYVLSMETCLYFCHISSMTLEMAKLFGLSICWSIGPPLWSSGTTAEWNEIKYDTHS